MMDKGTMMMPKQEVAEGQKHGYIGEDTGDVKTFSAPEAGSSNTIPDLPTAEARVEVAKRELERAQKDLVAAKQAKTDFKEKAPVGVVGGPTPESHVAPPTAPKLAP